MADKPAPKMILTWEWIERAAASMVRHCQNHPVKFDAILAVTRGGLPIAGMVAQGLDIRLISTVCVVTKHSHNTPQSVHFFIPDHWRFSPTLLVVDDISDTGETFKMLRRELPYAHLTCLIVKPLGKDIADSYLTEVDQDIWVQFPWEKEAGWTEKMFAVAGKNPGVELPN